jgi:hypothetical protein
MDEQKTLSKNGVSIRLPPERWEHIILRHATLVLQKDAVLRTLTHPEKILAGNEGALMAVSTLEEGKVLVVVYKEVSEVDGFVVTAFPTRRLNSLIRRKQLWP